MSSGCCEWHRFIIQVMIAKIVEVDDVCGLLSWKKDQYHRVNDK